MKFYSYSFGCRVNEAEKEEIDREMIKSGFYFDQFDPEIYIINSCAVTAKAEREVRQKIYQIRKKFPKTKIVITGCAATYWQKNSLYKDLPVDLIVDNLNKKYLVKLLINRFSRKKLNNKSFLFSSKFLNSGRVMLKIQDGCQRFCSYCIVPYLRGKPNSEKIKNLESTIKNLESIYNIKEIILTAVNTEAYGYDTGEKLIDLIQMIIDKTKIPRISFGSLHPWSINNEFLLFYKKNLSTKRIVDFFHIPIQSGSDKILKLMKRGYTSKEIKEKLHSINRLKKRILISTDIIVGFLDEDDKDFEETYNFLKDNPVSRFHIFRFSKRQNTASYFMADRFTEPSPTIKISRAKILAELSKIKYQTFLNTLVNWKSKVLFLEKRNGNYQEALLENQVPIWIKTDKNLTGEIKNVKITECKKGIVFGKII